MKITSLIPILEWLPNYKKEYLGGDLSAGLTVGIMLIPQGMAYAMIAGLPPVFGLYAALIPQVIYGILGTSRQLSVGPVAMDSLLVAAGLGALSLSGIDEYIGMAIFLALFMGLIQFLLGVVRMGFLVNFLSKPVISGFTSAAALIIGLSQLKHLLGTPIEGGNQIHTLVYSAFKTIDQTQWIALVLGLAAIVIIKGLKRIHKRIPGALIVTLLGIVATYVFRLDQLGLSIVQEVPKGLPAFSFPSVEQSRIAELFPIAMTLALIAFMEAISVAKAIEEKHKLNEVRPNQELIALGLSNVIGSLFQSYPTTGGFSRTAVNDQAGASSALASFISAAIVGLTLLFLTPLFYYLPNTVLAAIIMVAVFGLIDVEYPKVLWKNRKDEFTLLAFTFIITLTVGIKEGILYGVLLSLLLLVYRSSKPHFAVLARVKNSPYYRNIKRFSDQVEIDSEIVLFRFDAQLYFGNKDYFKSSLLQAIEDRGKSVKKLILNVEPMNYIDSSAAFMLKQLIEDLNSRNIKVAIAGPIGPIRDSLRRSGIVDLLGKEAFYENTHSAYLSAKEDQEAEAMSKKIALESQSEYM
ncbi:MAG: sulfate permease [Bacteroidetes bacterium]|nr:sulfate permease [Bacteroidota bacterium]MDA0950965.1 sulfate permease [Bacteroidota bacterium]